MEDKDDKIDYKRLAVEVAKAHFKEEDVRKDKEFGRGIAMCTIVIAGILIGLWTGKWWLGLLTTVGSLVLADFSVTNKLMSFVYAGGAAYLVWVWIIPAFWDAPLIAKVIFSLIAAAFAGGGFSDLSKIKPSNGME